MLTTTRTSRARLLSGATAIAVLTLAGLGLTASGTQAAATVRDKVATAVTLPSFAVAAPIAAELPAPPQAAELPEPPAPPAPPAPLQGDVHTTTTTVDGKQIKTIVVRRRDGSTETHDMPTLATLPAIPEITQIDCPGDAKQRPLVLNEQKDGKRRIVLCMNRIERIGTDAAAAATSGVNAQRRAMGTALAGLYTARRSIADNPEMDAAARTEALKGIDDAIVEVRQEMTDAK